MTKNVLRFEYDDEHMSEALNWAKKMQGKKYTIFVYEDDIDHVLYAVMGGIEKLIDHLDSIDIDCDIDDYIEIDDLEDFFNIGEDDVDDELEE